MNAVAHAALIALEIYAAYCVPVMVVVGALIWLHLRREKNRDPYVTWLEDALGRGAVKQYRAPRRQIRAARRELKTITTPAAMFATTKEHSDD